MILEWASRASRARSSVTLHVNMDSSPITLFKAGEYAAAAMAFGEVLSTLTGKPADEAVALTNRAACHTKLGDMAAAEDDIRLAIRTRPEYARAYARLAAVLPVDHVDAAAAVAAAVALATQPANDELKALYATIATASATSRGLRLPTQLGSLAAASTTLECEVALRGGAALVVLRPGTYQLRRFLSDAILVGVGSVQIRATPGCGHAILVNRGAVQLVNATLIGDGNFAASCCTGDGNTLRLVDCRVSDYPDVGVLVANSCSAFLLSCVFERLGSQAVEVREGGSLEAYGCRMEQCKQGVSAYGGARSVLLQGCWIKRCFKEGVLASGSVVNVATQMQASIKPGRGNAVSKQAADWGRARRLSLSLSVTDCVISHNGSLGLSIDQGCQAVVQRCDFQMNDPYAVLVKGASDASISASRFVFAGKSGKSTWAVNQGSGALKLSGVRVAVNYGGEVQVFSCAFSGGRNLGVDEEAIDRRLGSMSGMWSKPALALQNQFDCKEADMPSLDALTADALRITAPRRERADADTAPAAAALSRIGWTFPQPSWSPTQSQFYAIGNTQGFDVTAGLLSPAAAASPAHPDTAPAVRILLAGCGDPRNLVATAAAAPPGRQLDMVLNDGNVSMLARDAVLLHLATTATAEAVLAVWADHGLSAPHASALRASCAAIADGAWPEWLRASAGIEGAARSEAAAERAVREACRAWASCSMTLAQLLRSRDAMLNSMPGRATVLEPSLAAVGTAGASKAVQLKIKAYLQSGSLKQKPHEGSPNVTLLLSPSLQYCLYYSSSILRALPLAAAPPDTPLARRLLASLAPQLEALTARLQSGSLSISLVVGDILVVGAVGAVGADGTTDQRFDFIDCSNVADYVSITSLLQVCAPMLSRAPHARVRMESMVNYSLASDKAKQTFAQDATGLTAETLAALLRIRLVASSELPNRGLQSAIRMEWASADANPGGLSAGSLLLEILPRFSKVLTDGPGCADPASSLAGCVGPEGQLKWCPIGGGPLALVHLLTVSVGPAAARSLLDALLRTADCGRASLFQWELTMHVPRTPPALLALTLDAGDSGLRLMQHGEDPLLVALSRAPLVPGETALELVHQLLSSFHWDEGSGMATFLLPASLVAKCATLHVTLCALGRRGLDALSSSRLLGELPRLPQASAWRSLHSQLDSQLDSRMDSRLDSQLPAQDAQDAQDDAIKLDTSVLDRLGAASRPAGSAGWQAAVVRTARFAAVDVLAPKALLDGKAHVSAIVTEGELRVTVAAQEGSSAGNDEFSLTLPSGVADGRPVSCRMKRSLGLICMQVAIAAPRH